MAELKEKILNKAQELTWARGISKVTMDMIARECGISKRTLYEQIPDKRALVWESMLYRWDKNVQGLEYIIQNSPDTLSALLDIYLQMREIYKRSPKVYTDDLRRLFPEFEATYRDMYKKRNEEFVSFLEKGVEEGVIRGDVDLYVFATLFMLESHSIRDNMDYFPENLSIVKVCDMAFVGFVRGIATLEGLKILDEFLANKKLEK